jgi:NAD+ kinase
MERVGVVVHPKRPVLEGLEVVERWTRDRGIQLVQLATGEQPAVAPAGEVGGGDLIVALGGDGTILKALHASARAKAPVLGVSYGSLGALTTVPAVELRAGLDRFAAGDWRPRALPALAVTVSGTRAASAINDLVIARGRGTQLILDVCADGELYVRIAGDGVVVATPLGSSAYSMAAGGSLLAEGADAFLCTPLAMHGGCAPPLAVSGETVVTIEVHPGHSGFYVDVDGFPVDTEGHRFRVAREPAYATLVALDDARAGFTRLRARGLVSDSPRVIGQDRLLAELQRPLGPTPPAGSQIPAITRRPATRWPSFSGSSSPKRPSIRVPAAAIDRVERRALP